MADPMAQPTAATPAIQTQLDTSTIQTAIDQLPQTIKSQTRKRAPLIRRSDSEWLQIFKDLESSGQTLAEYCGPRHMSSSSFSTKRKALLSKYQITDILTANIDSITQSEIKKDSTKKPYRPRIIASPFENTTSMKPYKKTRTTATSDQDKFTMTFGDASFEFSTNVNPNWLADFIKAMNT